MTVINKIENNLNKWHNIETMVGGRSVDRRAIKTYGGEYSTTYVGIRFENKNPSIMFGSGTVQRYLLNKDYVHIIVNDEDKKMYFFPNNEEDGAKLTTHANGVKVTGAKSLSNLLPKIKSWRYKPETFMAGDVFGFYIEYTEN